MHTGLDLLQCFGAENLCPDEHIPLDIMTIDSTTVPKIFCDATWFSVSFYDATRFVVSFYDATRFAVAFCDATRFSVAFYDATRLAVALFEPNVSMKTTRSTMLTYWENKYSELLSRTFIDQGSYFGSVFFNIGSLKTFM